jgi:hypothetical protein
MDAAASGGHLDAVKWLHANRTEGCTIDALYQAAEEGHFEVVKLAVREPPRVSHVYGHRFGLSTWALPHCVLASYQVSRLQT